MSEPPWDRFKRHLETLANCHLVEWVDRSTFDSLVAAGYFTITVGPDFRITKGKERKRRGKRGEKRGEERGALGPAIVAAWACAYLLSDVPSAFPVDAARSPASWVTASV